ncbi:MAG: Chromosomal replication initiator protein DnaA [Candidatus Ordinivivax streblomastigis]|uniref:Chromosomal replication initiator protein DnaA n=1 Tax=Candidatus Ordinivivax streblomastigis TaxID=2540710 RepID=A0A5M8P3Y1_9BACT|nr:MAG: Chromosomal replication initiator protein DnaA [Candidatus Ordinivivax streblomastigis]
MKKIYISGAITGLPFNEVQAKFAAAEEKMSAEGYEVVSPLKTGIPYNFPWESHIAMDIVLLIGCEAVYLLSDWNISKGATLEKNIAELTGKEIIYETTPAFTELKQAISEVMRVSFYEIAGHSRKLNIVLARFLYCHLCKNEDIKITDLAVELNKNHSTIIYYLKKYQEEYKTNKQFRIISDKVEEIINKK